MAKTIEQMMTEIRAVNVAKGWRSADGGPGENTWGDYIALLHSEVSEALEAYRRHRLADATEHRCDTPAGVRHSCPPPKPEGVGSELADVLIRLLDMADVFEHPPLSGYDMLEDVYATPLPATSFGDAMAWLHLRISEAWLDPMKLPMVLRTLVAVARKYGFGLDAEYERKIAFNRTRSFRHGGRTL